ncbi:MAG TPA: hypothetical protein VF881_01700 [Polyangiaceae bacterium]
MSKSPAAIVKQQFGDKAKLVAALGPFTDDDLWVKRVNETKGLSRVSNAKLLKLYNVLSAVKEKFGNRLKLIDAICEIEKRAKDEGYKNRLQAYAIPRLYDLYRSVARRAGMTVEPLVKPAPRGAAKPAAAGEAPKSKPSSAKKASAKAPAGKAAKKQAAKKQVKKGASKGKAAMPKRRSR